MKQYILLILSLISFCLVGQEPGERYDTFATGTSLYNNGSRENSLASIASQLHRYNPDTIDVLYVHDPSVYNVLQNIQLNTTSTAGNGITKNGSTYELGDTLNRNTSIYTDSFNFDITSISGLKFINGNISLSNGALSLPFVGGYSLLPDNRYLIDGSMDATSAGSSYTYQVGAMNPNTFDLVGLRYSYDTDLISILGNNSEIRLSSEIQLITSEIKSSTANVGDFLVLKNTNGAVEYLTVDDFTLDDDKDTGLEYDESGIGVGDLLSIIVDNSKFMDMYTNSASAGLRSIKINAQDFGGLNMLSFTSIDTVTANAYGVVQNGSIIYDTGSSQLLYNNGTEWKPVSHKTQRDFYTLSGSETTITLSSIPTAANNITLSINGVIKYEGGAEDWTISGNTITFVSYVGVSGDKLEVKYY